MLYNTSMALYHYSESEEKWTRSYFPCAFVYKTVTSAVSDASFSQENHCIIRIPHYAGADIAIGDYVCLGNPSFDIPDTSCFKVISYTKNNFGSSPHLKLICA